MFEDNLDVVEIKGSKSEKQTLHNCFLIQNREWDGEWWFSIGEKSEEEVEKENMLLDIEAQAEAITELAEIIAEMGA